MVLLEAWRENELLEILQHPFLHEQLFQYF